MRFLLTTIGTAGDVHPFIGVGLALKRRGHEVMILANPHFAERVTLFGLKFAPLGTEEEYRSLVSDPRLVHPRRGPLFVLNSLMLPALRDGAGVMEQTVRAFRPDACLAHHICFAAPLVCEKRGVPCVTAVLAPLFWLSRHEPVIWPGSRFERLPPWAEGLRRRVSRRAARMLIDRPTNRVRRQLGFGAGRDYAYNEARGVAIGLDGGVRERPVLGLWSEHYRPALPDDPGPEARICGFSWFDRTSHPDPAMLERIKRFMEAGERPVIVTLGSSVTHHGADIYDLAKAACERVGKRVILLTGVTNSARNQGSQVLELPYAPYSRVLPDGCCTVHHGGIGTTAQAMRAGVPAVIIPFANDEFDNAARARRLGIAVTVKRGEVSVRSLSAAIEKATGDRTMGAMAQIIGNKVIAEDGAEVAADELERRVARKLLDDRKKAGKPALEVEMGKGLAKANGKAAPTRRDARGPRR